VNIRPSPLRQLTGIHAQIVEARSTSVRRTDDNRHGIGITQCQLHIAHASDIGDAAICDVNRLSTTTKTNSEDRTARSSLQHQLPSLPIEEYCGKVPRHLALSFRHRGRTQPLFGKGALENW